MRSQPESIGYGPLPMDKILIFLSICIGVLLVFLSFFYSACYCYQKRQERLQASEIDHRSIDLMPFLQLQDRGDDGRGDGDSNRRHSSGVASSIRTETYIREASNEHKSSSSSSSSNDRSATVRLSTPHGSQEHQYNNTQNWTLQNGRLTFLNYRKNTCFQRFARCCCISTVIAILCFIGLGIYLFPQTPEYSICSKRIDWTSVLGTLAKQRQVGADIEMLVSIYNPNRFTLKIEHIEGVLLYHNNGIGSGTANQLEFPAGSVVDFLLPTHLAADLSIAAAMYDEHLKDTLLLDVRLRLSTSVWLFNRPLGNFNTSYTIQDVSPEHGASRQYCKCKDP